MVINNQMLNVKGRSDLFLKAEIIKKIVAVAILCITLPFGVRWLCWGVLLYNLFDAMLIIWFTKRVIPIGYKIQFNAIFSILSITIISGFVSFGVIQLTNGVWISLIGGIIVFTAIFTTVAILLKLEELNQIKKILHKK